MMVFTLILTPPVDSGNVLLVPVPLYSFVNSISLVGEELKLLGHSVSVLACATHAHVPCQHDLNVIDAGVDEASTNFPNDVLESAMEEDLDYFDITTMLFNATGTQCEMTFQREEFWDILEAENFDLVIVPGEPDTLCYLTIPHRLSIPYVVLSAYANPSPLRVGSLPSVEQTHSVYLFENFPSLWHRMQNLYHQFYLYWVWRPSPLEQFNFLNRYAPDKPRTTLHDLYLKAEMWIFFIDTICLDYPRVEAPHCRYISGVHLKPAMPLPQDLQLFADSAVDGLVVVSLGSGIGCVPASLLNGI